MLCEGTWVLKNPEQARAKAYPDAALLFVYETRQAGCGV